MRYDLDLLHVVVLEVAQVVEQLLVGVSQLAVVDIDLRSRLAVDRNLVVVYEYTRRGLQQLHAVLAYRRGHVGHVHHETVGLAPYDLRLDLDPLDLDGRTLHPECAEIAGPLYYDMAVYGFITKKLDYEIVFAVGYVHAEFAVVVGSGPGNLVVALHGYYRGVCNRFTFFVFNRSGYGRLLCGKNLGRNHHRRNHACE